MKKKKSVNDSIKDGIRDLNNAGNTPDAEFDPNFGSPFFNRKSEGEIVRDRLVGSCRPSEGWYIRLEKDDSGSNEFVYKDKITNYDNWVDLKAEINDYVRNKTKAEIKKIGKVISYGSGKYLVTFCNVNGNRDQESIVIPVDAQEHLEEVPAMLQGGTVLPHSPDVNEILRTVQATQISPAEAAKQQFEMMKLGMDMAVGKEERSGNSNQQLMTMMMGMMTSVITAISGNKPSGPDPLTLMRDMIGTAKDLGVIKTETPAKEKSMLDMIQELRAMGIKVGNESDDITTQVTKMKGMIDLFRGFMGNDGGDERPPLWERIAEQHGGKIIDLFGGLVKMNGGLNAPKPNVMVRQPRTAPSIAPATRQNAPVSQAPYAPESDTSIVADENIQPEEINPQENAEMLALVSKFARELKDAVINDRTDKFPYITETISRFTKDSDFNIKVGQVTANSIIEQIMQLDGAPYADAAMKQKLISYVNRYIEFVRSQGPYYAQCSSCRDYASFDNKAEFEAEQDTVCRQDLQPGECQGLLQACY